MRWISVLCLSVLLAIPQRGSAQATGTVTGTVSGTDGRPLAGAAVNVAGTTRSAQTAADGRYTITAVPAGSRTVRATFAGYNEGSRSVTVAAGQTATANIQLTQQAVQVEGVVAIGYGTQRAKDVTGSVATVNIQQNVAGTPVLGADQALKGQIAGVQVNTATGVPGGGATIRVRGVSAVGAGGQPLYVVDGFALAQPDPLAGQVRSPLADIPPQDIESINVLKDASATAIYGSRGSNGVVIITTKKGRASARPQINISAYTGSQQLAKWGKPDLLNATQFATYMRERYLDEFVIKNGRQPTESELLATMPTYWQPWLSGDLSRYGTGTDWYQAALRNAPMNDLQVSVSGGNDRLRSYLSTGYTDQRGIQINTGYRRVAVRANVDATLSDRVSVGFNLAPTYTYRNLSNTDGPGTATYPIATPYDTITGKLAPIIKYPSTTGITNNPLYLTKGTDTGERTLRGLGSAFVNVTLLKALAFRSSMNVDRSDERRSSFIPSTVLNADGTPRIPSGTYVSNMNYTWSNENTLTLSPREFLPNQFIDLVVGYNFEASKAENTTLTGTNFPDDFVRTLNAAGQITAGAGTSNTKSGLESWLARANYNLHDQFILTGTVRRDGSSRFGPDRRWGTFPSAAAAWNVSNMGFMRNVGFVQDLKLRASLGYSGNNQISDFSYLGTLGTNNYVLNGQLASGRRLTAAGNSALGWERLREINVGMDAGILDRRVTFTVDAYRRKTQDLLLDVEVPVTSGFETMKENLGSVQNQGLEFSANTQNLSSRLLQWTTNLNVSLNRNKVLNLGGRDTLTSGFQEFQPTHISVVGQPLALFYGFKSCGIYSQADINNPNVAKYAGAIAGSMHWCDIDGNGVIEPTKDFTVIGNPYPKFTWGLTNNFTMGAFDLRVLVNGAVGADKYKLIATSQRNLDGNFNVTSDVLKRWRPGVNEDPNATVPVVTPNLDPNGRVMYRMPNEFMVYKAGYAWVKNLTLRYTLPARAVRVVGQRASIYGSVDNAWLFSSYNGNPEVERTGAIPGPSGTQPPSLTPGIDNNPYPVARTFTVGIDLGL